MSDYQVLAFSRKALVDELCEFCGCDVNSARGDEIKAYVKKIFDREMRET